MINNKKPVPAFLPGQENSCGATLLDACASSHTYFHTLTVSRSVTRLTYSVFDISARPPKSIQPDIICRDLTVRGSLRDEGKDLLTLRHRFVGYSFVLFAF